jgi:uncharacterized protein (TIGR02271 family)
VSEHIVAVFDNDAAASAAARELEGAGISASAIRKYSASEAGSAGTTQGTYTSGATTGTTTERQSGSGFWAWLLGEEGPATNTSSYEADRDIYDRRVGAGNVVLSITLNDDSQIQRAMSIVESHDPLEIDERTDESDTMSSTTSGMAASTTGREFSSSAVAQPGVAGMQTTSRTAGVAADQRVERADKDEKISLSEEQLNVGKRTVDRGTTRIRRYVVETPVEREVNLHSERVTIERRKPTGDAGAPGAGAFEERVVEVRETEEVPVVEKTARVAEEVLVHREATERVEKVRDTVRREEVDVTRDGKMPDQEPKR